MIETFIFLLLTSRFIIYEKGIEDQVDIVKPSVIGGLKSEEYLALNCHGKVNVLKINRSLMSSASPGY